MGAAIQGEAVAVAAGVGEDSVMAAEEASASEEALDPSKVASTASVKELEVYSVMCNPGSLPWETLVQVSAEA